MIELKLGREVPGHIVLWGALTIFPPPQVTDIIQSKSAIGVRYLLLEYK